MQILCTRVLLYIYLSFAKLRQLKRWPDMARLQEKHVKVGPAAMVRITVGVGSHSFGRTYYPMESLELD